MEFMRHSNNPAPEDHSDMFKLQVCKELRPLLLKFVAMQENPKANLVEMEKCRRKIEDLGRVLEDLDKREVA